MKPLWSVLVVAPAETQTKMAVEELSRSFGCTFQLTSEISMLQSVQQRYDLLIVELEQENVQSVLAVLSSFEQVRPYEHLIMFEKRPVNNPIDAFWSCGLSAFLPTDENLEGLYQVLNRHFETQRKVMGLNDQLREASDIAILSMSASSQLGEIIRFLEQSYQCRDYGELGELLNITLERLGVAGCGVIDIDEDLVYFGAEEKQDAWKRLMLEMRSRGRFVDIENRTITNFDSISVMARNMPEIGSEPYGRMKDMLFTLVEGAEARVKTLALERAVALSERAKSTFLRVMSHELRTPMNAILGFSGRLAARDDSAPISTRETAALGMIHENAERLMEMIEDLQDLSNIHVDTEGARSRVLVADVLGSTLQGMAAKATAKGLQFESHYSEAGMQAELDAARLVQVVKKLGFNAVKYTQHGHIRVDVSSQYSRDNGEELVIKIEDTGVGIPSEKLSELFRPFNRLYEDYTHHQQGTGLGLAVVKEFVADMGGRLDVVSKPQQGTCFSIRFPQFVTHALADDVELF